MQERNICSQTSTKITAVEENQGKWLLLTLKRFWIDKLLAKRTANSTAGIQSNWIVCRIRCWTYTFFHISSGTFIIRSYVNEHYDANCELEGSPWESIRLFFAGYTRRIFFWNVLISLRRSWCYSSWRSKLDLFACTLISSRIHYIFFYKSDIISSRWHPW